MFDTLIWRSELLPGCRAPSRAAGSQHGRDGEESDKPAHPEHVLRIGMIEQPAVEHWRDDAGEGKAAGDKTENLPHGARRCERTHDHIAGRREKTIAKPRDGEKEAYDHQGRIENRNGEHA